MRQKLRCLYVQCTAKQLIIHSAPQQPSCAVTSFLQLQKAQLFNVIELSSAQAITRGCEVTGCNATSFVTEDPVRSTVLTLDGPSFLPSLLFFQWQLSRIRAAIPQGPMPGNKGQSFIQECKAQGMFCQRGHGSASKACCLQLWSQFSCLIL